MNRFALPASSILTALLALALAVASTGTAAPRADLLGFGPAGAAEQRALEERYDASLDADNLREWMRRITAKPFYVGSPHNREVAEWMVEQFRSWGYEAELAEYRVWFPTPRLRQLQLLAPDTYTARLEEPALEGDSTSGVREDRLPPYNAYSADGDVTAELVYVNQGIPDDYEELERRGIDVEGKIVIARYGGSWRGIKPKVAAEHGAVGCLLYSDPRDDGYAQGDVYPEGPYRMEHGVQRGSVLDMPLYPGDPLTPGTGATADAERLDPENAPTLMKIPVLPISYADARPLLEALAGPVAPAAWRGALPITYHIGPGPARVRLRVEFDWRLTPAFDVVARIEGDEAPDEWVVRGNHRDGWALGAGDPTSGMVALMEEARALGELMEAGWRPRRTIVYAGWDAEEPGLLGSTEWAEHHAEQLRANAVAYVNTDGNGRGFLRGGGSHTLERFLNQVAADVDDPQTEVSVRERARAARAVAGDPEALTREDLRIAPLGSGSDYTPFLQHLGIATLHVGYGGESGGGSYHSIYDSFDHYTRFGDPGFQYGIALARTAGRITLRLAEAPVLPLRFSNFADNVAGYLEEVEALADELRQRTVRHAELVSEGYFELAADPRATYVPPEEEPPVPFFAFAPLRNAVVRLQAAAERYDGALGRRLSEEGLEGTDLDTLNALLRRTERAMLDPEGLPGRPWFRHQIYAPGFYTGYGVKTLPGVREAIEQRQFERVPRQVEAAAAALERVAELVDEATRLLQQERDGGR